MTRSRVLVLPFAVTLLAACGGPSGEVKSPSPDATSTAAANTAGANAAGANTAAPDASGTAAPAGTSAPKTDDKPSAGPYEGANPGKAVALKGPKAWTVGDAPDHSAEIGLFDFVRSDGTRNVFKKFAEEDTFSVPAAFSYQPVPVTVKKGDKVLVTVVTGGVCGRVKEVKGTTATVEFYWGSNISKRDFEPDEMILLNGKMGYGAPVYWTATHEEGEDPTIEHALFVYSDDKEAYVTGERKAPAKALLPVDVNHAWKPGDKVLASPMDSSMSLQPAIITKVGGDGLYYEYKDSADSKTTEKASYCEVIAAPAAKKK